MNLIETLILLTTVWCFLKNQDFLIKQISLFVMSFLIFVVASELFFGLEFSSKQNIYPIDEVYYSVLIFYLTFMLVNRNVKSLNIGKHSYPIKGQNEMLAMILIFPFLIFLFTYSLNNGIRITGDFMNYRGDRSILTDYMFVYFCVILVLCRHSKTILFVGIFAAFVHLLSAERARSFVYIAAILLTYFNIEQRNKSSVIVLSAGFFLATIVGLLRTGDGLETNSEYNITHFGSATVSSLYLLDYSSYLSFFEKLKFSFGLILGNIFPSSLLPIDYDIRGSLFLNRQIPGGGWLPVYFYTIAGGYTAVFVMSLLVSFFYRFLKKGITYGRINNSIFVMFLIFVSTAPRWFMYTPYQIFKMSIYGLFLYAFLSIILIVSMKKKSHES